MSFQSSVKLQQAFGVPGQRYDDSPMRAQPYTLVSDPVPNIMGATAYTQTSEGYAVAGGTGLFVGLLVDPKSQALFGSDLAPSMVVPDQAIGTLATMGSFVMTIDNSDLGGYTAEVGDLVIYSELDGHLATISPGAATPADYAAAIGIIDRFDQSNDPGNAVVTITYNPAAMYTSGPFAAKKAKNVESDEDFLADPMPEDSTQEEAHIARILANEQKIAEDMAAARFQAETLLTTDMEAKRLLAEQGLEVEMRAKREEAEKSLAEEIAAKKAASEKSNKGGAK